MGLLSPLENNLDPIQLEAFQKDLEPLLRDRVSIILLLGVVLVPLFGLLDLLVFPSQFGRFMIYRGVASCSCLLLFLWNHFQNLKMGSAYLAVTAFYIVGLTIIKMILDTGGYATPYYAGLNLVFLGFCTVLPLRPRHLMIHCVILYLMYISTVVLFHSDEHFRHFLGRNLFLLTTVMIVLVAARVNYWFRYKEYLLRVEHGKARETLQLYSESLESSIKESEEKYRRVVDHADEAIFILQDGVIKFPNPMTRHILGYSTEELEQLSLTDLVLPDDKDLAHGPTLDPASNNAGRSKRDQRPLSHPTFRIKNKAGEPLWVEMSCVTIQWMGRDAVLHLLRDITERKNMESELLQAQKMEAIGTLAEGIAHDFNNLLQVMSGYVEFLLMKKAPKDPEIHSLKQIDKSIDRAADLTQQLLIYGRKVDSRLEPVDLNEVITDTSSLLERMIPKMISIHTHLDPDLKKILADSIQLEQIIMNLSVNAKDVMPNGGRLVFETQSFQADPDFCKRHADISTGDYALLTISDTGDGMDEETLERIFDPFFTTKAKGKGTGLGLAIVYGIVKSHQGTIICRSRPGSGAIFEIYLPTIEDALGVPQVLGEESKSVQGNHETILFVDDDEALLEVGRDMLEIANFRMIEAKSGEQAIDLFKGNGQGISLIVLDLNMPGMGGVRCLEVLKKIDQDIKVIVATGYLDSESKEDVIKMGVAGYVEKPYQFQDMLTKIKQALEMPQR